MINNNSMAAQSRKIVLAVLVITTITCACKASFTPADNYLVDCGSSANTTVGTRTFIGDVYLPPSSLTSSQSIAAVSSVDTSSLYGTARLFTGPSSYSFRIKRRGRHFVRLYFFPFAYQNYDLTATTFKVSAQDLALLDKFNPGNGSSTVFKEFAVNITLDTLVLSFVPDKKLAFVNAIEVVSVPDDLIPDAAQTVNPINEYVGLTTEALETVHRINMGTPKVTPENDTLWRTWTPDEAFLLDTSLANHVGPVSKLNYRTGLGTPFTAPDFVYGTATELATSTNSTASALFNMTWRFDVAAGSSYFIRLHFCDIISKAAGQLYFNVYVGASAVLPDFDISSSTDNTLAVRLYRDFVMDAKDVSSMISVSVGPSTLATAPPDGILNGLEIMRMIGSSGSGGTAESGSSRTSLGIVVGSAAGAVAVMAILAFIGFCVLRKKRLEKKKSRTWASFSADGSSSRSRNGSFNGNTVTLGKTAALGYRFPFGVLQEATNGFDESHVIGVGGFGKVYRGVLRDKTKVAVKRATPRSQQGLNEFRTEIEMLSRLRHRHLVSLIGYCDERNEMILVYEYMAKGTLKSHLYGTDLPPLSWKQRLDICIGAARGLHYLHTGSAKAIIHRDVKSANILLGEDLMAKVSDFGLSKTGPELDKTHVSTAVKGSFGYLDPEYFRRQQLTEKSDVYSFGVVLLEVLCARPVIDPRLPREMVSLAEWATQCLKKGEPDRIVDGHIAGTIRPVSLKKFGETVEKCLADCGAERPAMGDVLWNLEYALQLQEAEADASGVDSMNLIPGVPSEAEAQQVQQQRHSATSVAGEDTFGSKLGDLNGVSMRRVFSRLIKDQGR